MSDHELEAPDLLVVALTRLQPGNSAVAQPAFLFRAGQVSCERTIRRWKYAALALVFALAVTLPVSYYLTSTSRERAEVAEAQLVEALHRVEALASAPKAPAETLPKTPVPVSSSPVVKVPEVSPSPPSDYYQDLDPTPQELADAINLRNEILSAGLTLLPQSKPPAAPRAHDLKFILPGGVFTTPKHTPKPPAPLFPDDE